MDELFVDLGRFRFGCRFLSEYHLPSGTLLRPIQRAGYRAQPFLVNEGTAGGFGWKEQQGFLDIRANMFSDMIWLIRGCVT